MLTRQALQEKRQAIIDIARRHGASDIRIFGSFARGDNDETSDLDLLVKLDPGRTLFDQGGLLMDLREFLGMKVDVVTDGELTGRFGDIVRARRCHYESRAPRRSATAA